MLYNWNLRSGEYFIKHVLGGFWGGFVMLTKQERVLTAIGRLSLIAVAASFAESIARGILPFSEHLSGCQK